ncbi:MAG: hypothetical protein IJL20_08945 [Lachnospiraceae bacterium]|nr:hypothetical protein [Lachnospiraceae bacterium]MBO4782758.1 hypothetical protein [Lachnospiraceae bacterium]MBQ6025717.1 hypothetical protein [Lachnospiraceae bacterium]
MITKRRFIWGFVLVCLAIVIVFFYVNNENNSTPITFDSSDLEIKDLQDDKQSTELREKRQDEYLEDMVNKMIEEQEIDTQDEKEYYRQKLLGEN